MVEKKQVWAAVTTTGKHLSPGTRCHFCCILLTGKTPDLPSLGPTGQMYARRSAGAGLVRGSAVALGLPVPGAQKPARSRPKAQPQDCVRSAWAGHCRGTGPLSHPATARPAPTSPSPAVGCAAPRGPPEQRSAGMGNPERPRWAQGCCFENKGFLPSPWTVFDLGNSYPVYLVWKTTNNQA